MLKLLDTHHTQVSTFVPEVRASAGFQDGHGSKLGWNFPAPWWNITRSVDRHSFRVDICLLETHGDRGHVVVGYITRVELLQSHTFGFVHLWDSFKRIGLHNIGYDYKVLWGKLYKLLK